MDDEQILAFRIARSGLSERTGTLAEAAAVPASDFHRDAALLAVAARAEGVTREAYDAAVDAGDVVVAHVIRGAIHAVAPEDHAVLGSALVASEDDQLAVQLGRQVQRLAAEHRFTPAAALDEVAAATEDALAEGPLDKNALHEALRSRVREELMPWCKGCGSHHVAPMLWRYATVKAGVRLDAERRYVRSDAPARDADPADAARRFLHLYGPADVGAFAEWAGVAKPHAKRLWDEVARETVEAGRGVVLADDEEELASAPRPRGLRLLPPGDPLLQKPNRPLLAPDETIRKRLFRPVASPGAVLQDGRLAGLWRAKAKGKRTEITVEPLAKLRRAEFDAEAERVARLRGTPDLRVVLG